MSEAKSFTEIMKSEGIASPDLRPNVSSSLSAVSAVAAVLLPDSGDDTRYADMQEYCANGFDIRKLRKLQRASVPEKYIKNLHEQTAKEAHAELESFLAMALQNNRRTVEIVHGKGLHSSSEPILRPKVRKWLSRCPQVFAWISCHKDGAVRVALRKVGGGSGGV